MGHLQIREHEYNWLKKLNKKYLHKGYPIYVPRRRTLNSAIVILQSIENIPFQKLTLELYFIIKDKNFQKVAEDYKRVIETAKVQPEKFVFQLYEFYKKEAKYIKESNLTGKYFDFVSQLQELSAIEKDPDKSSVYMALIQILLEQTMFLTQNNLDYNRIVVGVDTDGKIIESDDIYPNLDLPVYEVEKMVAAGQVPDLETIQMQYSRWNYSIDSIEDTEILRQQNMYFSYIVQYLIPFINEYTLDIVPRNIFRPEYSQLCVFPMLFSPVTDVDYDKILDKRRRTIPTNGLRINFSDGFLREVLFKEIYKSDQVILLYKLTTKYGELSGAYRTKSKVFFSAFYQTEEKEGKLLHDTIRNLILWFYTAYTCDVEGISLTIESYRRYFADIASELTFTQMGGKLKRVDSGAVVNHKIAGKDGYDTKIKNISGYIRKLPIGQTASENAVQLARSLGYDLATNETFVAPFQRAAWYKLKGEKI